MTLASTCCHANEGVCKESGVMDSHATSVIYIVQRRKIWRNWWVWDFRLNVEFVRLANISVMDKSFALCPAQNQSLGKHVSLLLLAESSMQERLCFSQVAAPNRLLSLKNVISWKHDMLEILRFQNHPPEMIPAVKLLPQPRSKCRWAVLWYKRKMNVEDPFFTFATKDWQTPNTATGPWNNPLKILRYFSMLRFSCLEVDRGASNHIKRRIRASRRNWSHRERSTCRMLLCVKQDGDVAALKEQI